MPGLGAIAYRFFASRIMEPGMLALARQEAALAGRAGAIRPDGSSPERFDIPLESLRVEGGPAMMPGFPRTMPPTLSSVRHIRRALASLDDNPAGPKVRASAEFLADLDAYARSAGASDVGYARLPRHLVFRERAVLHDNALVLTLEMDKDKMEQAPSLDTALMVMETYDRLGKVAIQIAEYLRIHGFSAHPGHPLGGLALYPPLAQMAGLGWRGMHGLIITPRHGPRVRLTAVYTSIENLPFARENEHGWIGEFCSRCRICLKQCPVGAIREQPVRRDGWRLSCVETEKCFRYFLDYYSCSICIKVCPFNQGRYGELRERFGEATAAM